LPGACGHHSGLDSFRFLAQPIVSQLFIVDMRHLNKYIDPVNKRPADTRIPRWKGGSVLTVAQT
jgi:hypothetical protein